MPPQYNRSKRLPRWLRWLIFPLRVAVVLSIAWIGAVMMLVWVPAMLVSIWRDRRRFLHRLQQEGRLITIRELRSRLLAGQGTLLIMEPKGPPEGWLYPARREQLDPDGILVPMQRYLNDEETAEATRAAAESLIERLNAQHSTATLARLSWDELKRLAEEFPEQVLVLDLPFDYVHSSATGSATVNFSIHSMP
jgi:hypothetical protein